MSTFAAERTEGRVKAAPTSAGVILRLKVVSGHAAVSLLSIVKV
jgi:hypothetical protein